MQELIKIKLSVPPQPGASLHRSHLFKHLSQCWSHKLTLISAPTGYGKTTLLTTWLHQSDTAATWLSLDTHDNDFARFWVYLIAALQIIQPDIGTTSLDMLRQAQSSPTETLLTPLLNDLANITTACRLILDNYHVIETPAIHHALDFLLDYLPPQVHIIIATRADPPLQLSRLRVQQDLLELRTSDLRFSPEAADQFLHLYLDAELSESDITLLTNRTEGWIAGLQLAALALQQQSDRSRFIQNFSGSHTYVADYLTDAVLAHVSDDIQIFLLQTSIVDQLTAPLCDAITQRDNSQQTLEQLRTTNLFIEALDERQVWYRYHGLFLDLLRQRLYRHPSLSLPHLHQRASIWYEQNHLIEAAILHTLAVPDFIRAATLIDIYAEYLWNRGEQRTLRTWLDKLPREVLHTQARLCIYQAMLDCMMGELDRAEMYLHSAGKLTDTPTQATKTDQVANEHQLSVQDLGPMAGRVAAVRAYMAFLNHNHLNMVRFAREALDQLPSDLAMWRSIAQVHLGDAHSAHGQLVAAQHAYARAQAEAQTASSPYYVLLAGVKQVVNLLYQGRLKQAYERCQSQLLLAERYGLSQTARAGGILAVRAAIRCEWNDLDGAFEDARQAIGLVELEQNVVLQGLSVLCLARVRFAQGDLKGVEAIIDKVNRWTEKTPLPQPIQSAATAWKIRLWLVSNTKTPQREGLLASHRIDPAVTNLDNEPGLLRADEYLAQVRRHIAQSTAQPGPPDLDEPLSLLARMQRVARDNGWEGRVIETLMLQALAHQARGNLTAAFDALHQALQLAEPEGYIRLFINEGEAMAKLLDKMAFDDVSPVYVSRLRAAFITEATPEISDQLMHTFPLEPLTSREQEVLRFLATTDLSVPDIATEFGVAASTIRTHVKHIYNKLDVHSRFEATLRANALNLI